MANYARGTMPEERRQIVEEFCSICDRHRNCSLSKEIIGFYGIKMQSDQERYAMKGLCGWAIVNGRDATIVRNEEDGDVVQFKDAETVPRSELVKEVSIEVIEPKRLPAPD